MIIRYKKDKKEKTKYKIKENNFIFGFKYKTYSKKRKNNERKIQNNKKNIAPDTTLLK
jgi:hypothetical protein